MFYLGTILTFARLRSTVNPVMSCGCIFAVLSKISVPKCRPAQKLHLGYARNMGHDPASGAFHSWPASLYKYWHHHFHTISQCHVCRVCVHMELVATIKDHVRRLSFCSLMSMKLLFSVATLNSSRADVSRRKEPKDFTGTHQ